MQPKGVLEPAGPANEVPTVSAGNDYALSVTTIYQNLAAREWAAETWNRLTRLAGSENIRIAPWRISDLSRPDILEDAIESATHADVIVIAVSAMEELPIELCIWIDLWLPRRARGGALVALLGLAGGPAHHASRTREYLRDVANRSGLAFLPHDRVLAVIPSDPLATGPMAEVPDASMPEFAETVTADHNFDYHNYDGYQHWGLNE